MKESVGFTESVEKDDIKASETDPRLGSCIMVQILANFHFRSNPMGFNKRRPKFMASESFLDGGFQNLFELSYFSGRELVPTGWNVVDDDKVYPRLSSRSAQIFHLTEESDNDQDMTNGRSESESSNEDGTAGHQNYSRRAHMAEDEDSDEDEISRPLPRVSLQLYLTSCCSSFFAVSWY